MRDYLTRLLRRGVLVAAILAGLGYVYARVFLTMVRSNGVETSAVEAMLWRMPLAFAAFGVAFMAAADALILLMRRRSAPAAAAVPAAPPPGVAPPAPPEAVARSNEPRGEP